MSTTSSISGSVNALNSNLTSSSTSTGTAPTTSTGSNYATTNTLGSVSSLGIGSGINASSLISSLMAANQAPINAINNEISGYQANLSAYGSLSASVYAFQTSLDGLNTASDFESTAATSSDSTVLSATTTSLAPQGTYAITVNQLASAQTLVAAGQSSATAAIGSGASTTINFQFGTISGGSLSNGSYTGSTFTQGTAGGGAVVINSSNNSLQGIAAAINAANVGVTARDTRPRRSSLRSRSPVPSKVTSRRMRSTTSRASVAADVGRNDRVVRSKRRVPIPSSNCRIKTLMADWVTESCSAAALNFCS